MTVLDKGLVPKVMSLKEVLAAFAAHRREVLERRSTFRLEKIRARLEVWKAISRLFEPGQGDQDHPHRG
jgi:topoisomerase-4 subunit A